jgi:hypothetical protein
VPADGPQKLHRVGYPVANIELFHGSNSSI